MVAFPLLLAAGMAAALPAQPVAKEEAAPTLGVTDLVGQVIGGDHPDLDPPPQQRFSWLSPTVEYAPEGVWETQNLNARAETHGPVNATVRAAGTGIKFDVQGNPQDFVIVVNGTDAAHLKHEDWGKNAHVEITSTKPAQGDYGVQVNAQVSGLEWGLYEFVIGSKDNLTFNGALPDVRGAGWKISPKFKLPTLIGRTDTVKRVGQWDEEEGALGTVDPGAKLIITPPKGTAFVEVTAGQPPVPFGDFKATITPAPRYAPAVEEFYATLQSGPIQALIFQQFVPIWSAVLNPNIDYTIELEYIGDGERYYGRDTFAVQHIGYYESEIPQIQNGTAN